MMADAASEVSKRLLFACALGCLAERSVAMMHLRKPPAPGGASELRAAVQPLGKVWQKR